MNAATAVNQRRALAVAVARHDTLKSLTQAVDDAQSVTRLLVEQHGYAAEVLVNPTREQLQDALPAGSLTKGDLIVVWIGHGQRGPDGTLQLLGTKGRQVLASAGDLGGWVAETGAQQMLLLLDTCHAGGGLMPSLGQAFAAITGRRQIEGCWIGVLAASRAEGEARAGALIGAFMALLSRGPCRPDVRWTAGQPGLRGDDALQALQEEWKQSPFSKDQTIMPVTAGEAQRPMLRNARFDVGLGAQPVEHLLQAARGGSEVESYFTGRVAALTEMVAWVHAQQPGLLAVVGPAGCGKSALLGRLGSLSMPEERARLLRGGPLDAELDPGVGSIHAQMQLRGLTTESAAERLASLLGVDPAQGLFGVLALAQQRRELGAPLVLLLDGLDETGEQAGTVVVELLGVLARQALVLVTSRHPSFGGADLQSLPGAATRVVDLSLDPAGTLNDVHRYVVRRLAGVSPAMDPVQVADALTSGRGLEATAPFLLARLTTSQLRDQPLDTAQPDWRLSLVTSAQSALEQDLHRVLIRRKGQDLPDAARELMAALAWAHGAGFPADDLWPQVATRLSRHGTHYTRDDVYALLDQLGRHVVSSVEHGQQVFRIAHRVLVEHLMSTADAGAPQAVAQAVHDAWAAWMTTGLAPQAHGYLWQAAWLHMGDAGAQGLALMEQLAARDRPTFLLDLALAYERAADRVQAAGDLDTARGWMQKAVGCRRDLQDPRRLAQALFRLSLICVSGGHDDDADDIATEAVGLARELRSDEQARDVVTSAWFARALALVRLGKYDSARRWARELLDFLQEARRDGDSEAIGLAHVSMSVAAAMQNDTPAAREHGRLAVEALDAGAATASNPVLLRDALGCWAYAESMLAVLKLTDTLTPDLLPIDLRPLQRLLADHRRGDLASSSADIATAKGLFSYARVLVAGMAGDLPAEERPDVAELLDTVASMTRHPRVSGTTDAVVLHATALTLRATLSRSASNSRPDEARGHLADAIAHLRAAGAGTAFVRSQLGECLNLMIEWELADAGPGALADLDALILRQTEAAGLLSTIRSPTAQLQLIGALARLSGLQIQAGKIEDAAASREQTIRLLRAAPFGSTVEGRRVLAWLLAEEAGHLASHRAGEALTLAEESVALIDGLPARSGMDVCKALALNNGVAARLALDRPQGCRPWLDQALQLLADVAEGDLMVEALRANAALNLAILDLREGLHEQAVTHASQAVRWMATPGISPVHAVNAVLAEAVLGQAEVASGQVEAGKQRLGQVLAHVRLLVEQHLPDREPLVIALVNRISSAAPEMWPALADALQSQPALRTRLHWMRSRTPEQWPGLARELDTALREAQPHEQRDLRQVIRRHRAVDPARFDAAWQQANGELPAWLDLAASLEWSVIGWWNTPNGTASRDYLLAHPELLQGQTDAFIDELGLIPACRNKALEHQALLAAAREQGVMQAYAPMLLASEVQQWMHNEDPQGHLAKRPELRRAEVGLWLQQQAAYGVREAAAFLSVWQLLQRGEDALAFSVWSDPAAGGAGLQAAWRSSDTPRLAALARLVWARSDGPLRRRAALVRAVAAALDTSDTGLPDLAGELAGELAGLSADEGPALMSIVTDTMTHHPAAAGALAALISVVHQAAAAGA